VLRLVAVDAEILPVAAVRWIVLVMAVLVVHGEQVQAGRVKLPRTLGSDPAVEGERALAVPFAPGSGRGLRLPHERVDVDGMPAAMP